MTPETDQSTRDSNPSGRMNAKQFWKYFAVSGGVLLIAGIFSGPYLGMGLAKWVIPRAFSNLDHLAPEDAFPIFKMTQDASDKSKNLFIDVRSDEEYQTSHIPGAVHMQEDATPTSEEIEMFNNCDSVIIYCAAGFRSSKFAGNLANLNVTNVKNLNGGIFAWSNEGYPISGDKVHPYSAFGKWLLK